jgi:DMSO/TMAO reductase YedYZ molybdopterin-dependent catalytic subunit
MEIQRRIGIALLILCVSAGSAVAAGLSLGGEIERPAQLGVTDLQALPAVTVTVSFLTSHGPESGTYTGALLWTILNNATLGGDEKSKLRHTILVSGSDGYTVALAVGELDPNFEGEQAIIAYARDGKPLGPDDGLRLIVPGDKHGGRDVKDVVHIEVK